MNNPHLRIPAGHRIVQTAKKKGESLSDARLETSETQKMINEIRIQGSD
jgi:hypothetical protein